MTLLRLVRAVLLLLIAFYLKWKLRSLRRARF